VAMHHIDGMIDEELPARAVFLLGRITERYVRRSEELKAAFPEVYAGVRGKPWRQLRRTLKDGRTRAMARMPKPRPPRLRPAPPPRPRKAPRLPVTAGRNASAGLAAAHD
jgi:hypothetical protein